MNKRKLTEEFLKESTDIDIELDQLYKKMWVNLRNTGGMRLTVFGKDFLIKNCDIEHMVIELQDPIITMKQILSMDKKIDSPFFVEGKFSPDKINRLYLFDGRVFVMLAMYRGNLTKFLDAIN